MDSEFVDSEALGLTFVSEVEELGSRRVVELRPGGKEIVVNSQNRKDYVNLIVQHHFVQSISEQVSSFAQGFADILHYGELRESFFQSLELEDLDMMLHGSGNEISVEDWKAHTDYDGYRESDPQIVWFWEVCRCRTLLIPYLYLRLLAVDCAFCFCSFSCDSSVLFLDFFGGRGWGLFSGLILFIVLKVRGQV